MPGMMWLFWHPRGEAQGTEAQKRNTDSSSTCGVGFQAHRVPAAGKNPHKSLYSMQEMDDGGEML
jgi:hypothetical protein